MLKANIAKSTGITVLNSSFRCLNISKQDMGIISGQKIVEITNITKDKSLSSGESLGWRR
jgi:hypothetical protein